MTGRAVPVDVRMMIVTWPKDAPRGAVGAFCREHGVSRSRFYEIRALAGRVGALDAVSAGRGPRQRPDLLTPAAVEAAGACQMVCVSGSPMKVKDAHDRD